MCCGSRDDYFTVTPYRPSDEKPHPSVSRDISQWYHQPQTWGLEREEIEKRQRQAKASDAAQRYGWPTDRAAPRHANHPRPSHSRDSIIEPNLAIGLTTMSGLDYAAVYDPHHPPSPPRPTRRPPYHGARIVNQQPGMTPPMNAPPMRAQHNRDMRWESQGAPQHTDMYLRPMAPPIWVAPKQIMRAESPVIPHYLTRPMPPIPQQTPAMKVQRGRDRSKESLETRQLPSTPMPPMNAPQIRTPPKWHARAESPIVHQRPPVAQEVVVHEQDRPPPEPETARISYLPPPVKRRSRDSNRVSLLSDDGVEFLINRSVSPIND
ncbi:hypothetical protein F4680DRAFT_243313 [Xylaria scruposa]|nr:hypothetical protein F4680DRAFT_243313 [Xylaria scruposa]